MNTQSVPKLVGLGILLILVGCFLPYVTCEGGSGWYSCSEKNIELFSVDAFKGNNDFNDGIMANFFTLTVMAAAAMAVWAAVEEKGLLPVGLTVSALLVYRFYLTWETIQQEESLDVAFGYAWIPLFLGAVLIVWGGMILVNEDRRQQVRVQSTWAEPQDAQGAAAAAPPEGAVRRRMEMSPQRRRMAILALVGLLIMTIGVFVPVSGEADSLKSSALFAFYRFEKSYNMGALGTGMMMNVTGIPLLIIAALTIYPAFRLQGLGVMNTIALVNISLLLDIVQDGESKLDFGWLLLYGGLLVMIAANLQSAKYPEYLTPQGLPPDVGTTGASSSLGQFEPPSES
jgi:hypothetical protein